MVRWYGDKWDEKIVVEPVGHTIGYDWTKKWVVGEPSKGGKAYVGMETQEFDGKVSTYVNWIVNAKNKILSMEDYQPVLDAQQRKIATEYAHKESQQDLKRSRFQAMARLIVLAGDQNEIQVILATYFHLNYDGEKKADNLYRAMKGEE